MARVLLLFGGRSAEHEVSCVSAVAVTAALEGAGHDVTLVGIDRDGGWHLVTGRTDPLVVAGPDAGLMVPGSKVIAGGRTVEFDVAFPVLHGPYGEDGTIQGLFEVAGIRYVGCGVLSSSIAMDKDVAKRLAQQAGIPTTPWRTVHVGDPDDLQRAVDEVIDGLGLPVFVKPAALGSSVGVSRAADRASLEEALALAGSFGAKIVVEEAIEGREIEVAVLGGGPRASVPGEIVLRDGWYDYDAKYRDDTSRFVAPAPLDPADAGRVRELACAVFDLYECAGLARVDFLFEEGRRGFLLNEVNTMPGFTPISGFPKMWEASGMTYAELCDELVRLAGPGLPDPGPMAPRGS